MFSFHKPKIYRSVSGCCICKAKSSSSRFTDSKKYESEFEKCFCIKEKRSGEICNACVLLVKRWKKLPAGTNRDWSHVVDARAGPGTKCVNKAKAKTSKRLQKKYKIKRTSEKIDNAGSPGSFSDDLIGGDDSLSETSSLSHSHSRAPSPSPSSTSEDSGILEEQYESETVDSIKSTHHTQVDTFRHKRVKLSPKTSHISSFLDMNFWKKEKICCGIIFKGPNNEVLIYPKLLRPCSCRKSLDAGRESPHLLHQEKSQFGEKGQLSTTNVAATLCEKVY
ncbi:protein FAM60A-like [Limulus polyphemus]|uniref:Protein FAM60A-like n=1 Tax=Limulus polyphemus TaxID=6850 RepID=A0ABM1SKF6_LIMPO|nr:protein FAM60A-like [Limulus polyphemus]XP_022244121.1 protein FAM60A-like [Limulus polyphemus]